MSPYWWRRGRDQSKLADANLEYLSLAIEYSDKFTTTGETEDATTPSPSIHCLKTHNKYFRAHASSVFPNVKEWNLRGRYQQENNRFKV